MNTALIVEQEWTEVKMNKNKIEKRIEELTEEIENCKDIIKSSEEEIERLKVEAEKLAFERVEKGQTYYYVSVECGKVITTCIEETGLLFDNEAFENNNYFHTRERAEEVTAKINFLLKLERLHDIYCPNYKPDWHNMEENKWYVTFDSRDKKYTKFWTDVYLEAVVYFDSIETADKVCEILNKELENAQLPRLFL